VDVLMRWPWVSRRRHEAELGVAQLKGAAKAFEIAAAELSAAKRLASAEWLKGRANAYWRQVGEVSR
jgi:hypothetical protein